METAFTRALLEKHNQTLTLILIGSVALNLLLGVGYIKKASAPPLIVRKEFGDLVKMNASQFEVNEEQLKDFVTMVAGEYLSFTPTSLTGQIKKIDQYLESSPRDAILETYEHNKERILEERIFHQFVIKDVTITKRSNPYWVEVSGIRSIVSTRRTLTEEKSYVFEVKKLKPSVDNLYGLCVTQVVEGDTKKGDASNEA